MSGSIVERVSRLLRDRMALAVPSAEADLVEAGFLDSLALVTMLQHLEEEFGVRVGADDLTLEQFRSIARIARFIERCSGKEHGDARDSTVS